MNAILAALGQTVNLTKSNSESTAAIIVDLQNTKNAVGGLAIQIKNINDNIGNIGDRMNNIEQSEEITTEQNENIIETVRRRIGEILGQDPFDRSKYYRIFAQRLYSDVRRKANMGSKAARTRKRDYQRVIDCIEAWTPSCGITNLKREADKNAAARKKAKEDGYID